MITMPILVLAGQKEVDDDMMVVAIRPREVSIRQTRDCLPTDDAIQDSKPNTTQNGETARDRSAIITVLMLSIGTRLRETNQKRTRSCIENYIADAVQAGGPTSTCFTGKFELVKLRQLLTNEANCTDMPGEW